MLATRDAHYLRQVHMTRIARVSTPNITASCFKYPNDSKFTSYTFRTLC